MKGIEDQVPPYWDEIERAIADARTWPVKLSDDYLMLLTKVSDDIKKQYRDTAETLYWKVKNWAADKSTAESAGADLNKASMTLLFIQDSYDKVPDPLKAKIERAKSRIKGKGIGDMIAEPRTTQDMRGVWRCCRRSGGRGW
jgi:hypothetical protein